MAARVARDAPELPTGQDVKDFISQTGDKVKDLFSEKNIDEAKKTLGSIGDSLQEGFQKISQKIKESTASLQSSNTN